MTDYEICIEAAQLADRTNEFSCLALGIVSKDGCKVTWTPQRKRLSLKYARLFCPDSRINIPDSAWLSSHFLDDDEKEKEFRVLALLLFAQMIKWEEL